MPVDMDALDKRYKEERQSRPEAVGCKRKDTYDAELAYGGVHYVIGTGFSSHNLARDAAEAECVKLRNTLLAFGKAYIQSRKWKEAQP